MSYFRELTPGMIESKLAVSNFAFRPELWRDQREQVDVDAVDGLAVGVEELVRRVGGVAADGDRAVGLDLGRAPWRPAPSPPRRCGEAEPVAPLLPDPPEDPPQAARPAWCWQGRRRCRSRGG